MSGGRYSTRRIDLEHRRKDPAQATAGDLRYQLSFGQTARECSVQGGAMSIKVGVQGRVILGPMGGPGIVDVPLRYAVVREGRRPRPSSPNSSGYR